MYFCRMVDATVKADDVQNIFADFLTRTHRRHTLERVIVLRVAVSLKGHFTVEALSHAIEQNGEHIAIGTVYGTVQLLVECGLLVRHSFGGSNIYEAAPAAHSHCVCTGCGKIRDIRLPEIERQVRILHPTRFTPSALTVTIYGLCSTCARRLKRIKTHKEVTQTNHTKR